MSNLASMPMTDYKNICDKIREKTNTTEVIKSDELKDSIPLIFSNGQLDAVQSSDVLKGSLSGNSLVSAKDVSPYTHNIDCFLTSKNLMPFPYFEGSTKRNGVTFTVNYSDGTITVNGTATARTDFILYANTNGLGLDNSYHYRLTGCPSGGSKSTYWIQTYYGFCDYGSGVGFGDGSSPVVDKHLSRIAIWIENGYTAENLVFKPMIFKGTGSTPYALRVKNFSGITLKKYGKNLYPVKNFRHSKKPSNTYYASQFNDLTSIADYLVGRKITISVNVENNSGNNIGMLTRWLTNGSISGGSAWARMDAGVSGVLTSTITVSSRPASNSKFQILLYDNAGGTLDSENAAVFTNLQVEIGSDATPYEQYIAPITYTVNSDGTVEGVSSLYPSMTLLADSVGVVVNADYTKDIDATFNALSTAIAMSGGN